MNISIYMNDGSEVSSIDIQDATSEEALTAIRAFGFGENEDSDKICIKDLTCEVSALKDTLNDTQDECDEWKEKYKIECQNNDAIKKSYDRLTDSFENLLRDRDEWRDKSNMLEKCYKSASIRCVELLKELEECKEIASDRDDLKVQLDNANLTIESLRVNRDEWYNSYRDKQNLCDKINAEKDELQKMFNFVREDLFKANHQVSELIAENDKLKKDINVYKYYLKKILFDKGYSNEAMAALQLMERKECQNKKSES